MIGFSAFAQFSLESNFNVVHIGRNQNILAKYQWNKFSLNAGIKYNFNKLASFPQSQTHFFKKTFWAIDFIEHIGAEMGFDFNILEKESIDLFGFYQVQVTKSHIRHEVYYASFPLNPDPQSQYDYAYALNLNYIGPIWAFENNLGIGMRAYFSKSFYFSTKIGGGIAFYKNLDKNNILIGNLWELSEMVSFGLGWKFLK